MPFSDRVDGLGGGYVPMIVESQMKAYNQQDNKGTYKEDTIANAIRARGGMYGGVINRDN